MKKFIFASIIMFAVSFSGFSQENAQTFPKHISKEVHRVQLASIRYQPAVLVSGQQIQFAKGISKFNTKVGETKSGLIVTSGMPAHVISKDVARLQYKKRK